MEPNKIVYAIHGEYQVASVYDLRNGSQVRAARRLMRRAGFDWFKITRDGAGLRVHGVRKIA